MKTLVSGSTGLIGSALVPFLKASGHEVVRLVRPQSTVGEPAVRWDPEAGAIAVDALEGFDAVVHLAGENIAAGRWTPKRKARIRDTRVKGTRLLCETLASLKQPPKVLVCASAVGYYGHRGADVMREDSAPGAGFLAETCRAWEEATQPAHRAGIRVVNLRTGIVLTPAGGALRRMLTPFRLGLGGVLGSGAQYMSWISLDDVLGAIVHALTNDALSGPVNAVAPNAVTNREFTKILGRVLKRPTIFPVPAFVVRLLFGEMGEELLLASTRVEPAKLLSLGYSFRWPQLEPALRHLLPK